MRGISIPGLAVFFYSSSRSCKDFCYSLEIGYLHNLRPLARIKIIPIVNAGMGMDTERFVFKAAQHKERLFSANPLHATN